MSESEKILDPVLLADAAFYFLGRFIDSVQAIEDPDNTRFGVMLPEVHKNLMQNFPDALIGWTKSWLNVDAWFTERWQEAIPVELAGLSELVYHFKLSREDSEILVFLAGLQITQSAKEYFSALSLGTREGIWRVRTGPLVDCLSCRDLYDRERYASRLDPGMPLVGHRLVMLHADSDEPIKERRYIYVSDTVMDFLRNAGNHESVLCEALYEFCERETASFDFEDLCDEKKKEELLNAITKKHFHLVLKGPKGTQKSKIAANLARNAGKNLLKVDLSHLLNFYELGGLREALSDLRREVTLHNDCIYFKYCELPPGLPRNVVDMLREYLIFADVVMSLSDIPHWLFDVFEDMHEIEVELPAVPRRLALWKNAFSELKLPASEEDLSQIARRYALSQSQIAQGASESHRLAKAAGHNAVSLHDLDNACRRFFSHHLSDFAELVPTLLYPRERLILEDDVNESFNTIIEYLSKNHVIFEKWGFNAYYPNDSGLTMLFYGPPGTGKTMAACVIGNIFSMDLYRIDVSRIMNRYIGETEKNLARIFDEAEKGRVILLFDEADSLFSKRTQVKSSVDKYSNTEVTYLLQRMEQYRGIVVLTTNEEKNLDEAFKRRLGFRLHFGKPKEETRARIFRTAIPDTAPVRNDIPYHILGRDYELSGGNIKKAVLRAAFYAASADEPISLKHLVRACQEELKEDERLISTNVSRDLQSALDREESTEAVLRESPRI